jgi:hypothetical protein
MSKIVLGVDPTDDEHAETIASFVWADPTPITLEMRNVDIETMEIAVGVGLIPLCRRQIPAEGTE